MQSEEMLPDSRTGAGESYTGLSRPTEKLPEVVLRTVMYFTIYAHCSKFLFVLAALIPVLKLRSLCSLG